MYIIYYRVNCSFGQKNTNCPSGTKKLTLWAGTPKGSVFNDELQPTFERMLKTDLLGGNADRQLFWGKWKPAVIY